MDSNVPIPEMWIYAYGVESVADVSYCSCGLIERSLGQPSRQGVIRAHVRALVAVRSNVTFTRMRSIGVRVRHQGVGIVGVMGAQLRRHAAEVRVRARPLVMIMAVLTPAVIIQ